MSIDRAVLDCGWTRLVQMHNGRWLDIGWDRWSCDPAYYVDNGFGELILYVDPEDE